MPIKQVGPQEANELLSQGWAFLDVRSVPEFEQGHPVGACNVPLMHAVPGQGMEPNPDFLAVVQQHFARDARIVVGCRSGARSMRAAEALADLGYSQLVNLEGGFSGTGNKPGWQGEGLPVAAEAGPGKSYRELAVAAGRRP